LLDAVGEDGTVISEERRSWIRTRSKSSVIKGFDQRANEEVEKSGALRSFLSQSFLFSYTLVSIPLTTTDADEPETANDV
jgi:hypothetical protein